MPKRSPAHDRERDGEREHAAVDRDLAQARQVVGGDGEQSVEREAREEQAESAADQREHQALGQELAQEAGAAGADRGAQRHLALARRGAGEQQARDVGAGDQQHEGDRAEQHHDRGPDRADHVIAVGDDVDAEALLVGIALLDRGVDAAELGLRLRELRCRA